MKLIYLIILTALGSGSGALAADSSDRSSPLDNNPACMDRTTDSASDKCTIADDGTPRHVYPWRLQTTGSTSGTTPSVRGPSAVKATPHEAAARSSGK